MRGALRSSQAPAPRPGTRHDKGHDRYRRAPGYIVAPRRAAFAPGARSAFRTVSFVNSARALRPALLACIAALCCACAHARSNPPPAPEALEDIVVAEPAAADDIDYVFKMSCRDSPGLKRRHVVVEGYVTSDNAREQRSGLSALVIDGVALDALALREINREFPPDAVQDRPWMRCDRGTIEFTVPYNNADKRGRVRFKIDSDRQIELVP